MFSILTKLPFHQLINQLVFLYVGKAVFKLSVTWYEIAAVLVFSVIIEHVFLLARDGKRLAYSPAALSTGFNMAFMLGTTALWVYFIALVVGLGQKHLLKRIYGEHFLNPSNIGITAALLLFPNYTYVTFTDWGVTIWFALLIVALGSFILWRVGLLFVPYLFLATFVAFGFLLQTHNVYALLQSVAGAGFLLFAFFMITDPKATPGSKPFLAAHAVLTAFLCNVIPMLIGPKEVNIFLALTLSGLFVPLWKHFEKPGLHAYRRRALLVSGVVLAVVTTAAYFSPWNVLRNVLRSQRSQPRSGELTAALSVFSAGDITSQAQIWGQPDPELYKKEWAAPHVVKQRLWAQSGREDLFLPRALPEYGSRLTPEMMGDDTNLVSGVAAGDINADGYPDVILSRVGRPILVLVNDRRGGFSDFTARLFPHGAPADVEHAALADFNNDTRLDLLLVFSQYYGEKRPAAIYWFDPAADQFVLSEHQNFAAGKKSAGGISVHDLNADKKLDFYISFGIDWHREDTRKAVTGELPVLYMSDATGWSDVFSKTFEDYFSQVPYVGMTALFTDFNLDGAVDFLAGNDFDDPSFAFAGRSAGGFELLGSDVIENNTQNSMSYFPIDVDNDGTYELWENGISDALTGGKLALQKRFEKPNRSLINQELARLEVERAIGKFTCETYRHPTVAVLCRDASLHAEAVLTNNKSKCSEITSSGAKHACHWMLNMILRLIDNPAPGEFKYDVEKFPKQLQENVLLQYDPASRKYVNRIKDLPQAGYTGFTWCAFPFDVNNDGLQDIFLTTGMPVHSHDYNRLLINRSTPKSAGGFWGGETAGKIDFEEAAARYQVDSENDGRGAVIADFDLDGDGDLLLNNYLVDPEYFENRSGGRAMLIELRSKHSNYYALGSTIKLVAGESIQLRSVNLGGHWNTSQPVVQHFGLENTRRIDYVEVRWPNGNVTKHDDLEAGFRYVIYE